MQPNIIAGYVFLSLFCAATIIHLVFCYLEKEKLRKITKCFCLFFLSLSLILFMPNRPLIYIGAIIAMLGDFFLLRKKVKIFFGIGALLFAASHFFYLAEMILVLNSLNKLPPYYVFIIVGAILFILIFALYPLTKSVAGKITFIGNFYMPFLLCMSAFGLYAYIVTSNSGGILFMIGYLLALISDTILIITTFKKDIKRRDFYIMLSYLAGEVCIVIGLLSLNGFLWH